MQNTKNTYQNYFIEYLNQILKKNNITISELIDNCNIKSSFFYKFKNNSNAGIDFFINISEALNLPLSDFFSIEDNLDNGFKRFNVVIPKSDNFLENITNIYNYSLIIPTTKVHKITPEKAQEAIILYMNYFVDYLKNYMLKHKLSITKFASQANISKSHFHTIVHLTSIPTLDVLAKICDTYSIYLPDLFRVPEKQQLSLPDNHIRLSIILPYTITAMEHNTQILTS